MKDTISYYYKSLSGYNKNICQDYCRLDRIGDITLFSCSDGAGSSKLSHIGSKIFTDIFYGIIKRYLSRKFCLNYTENKKRIFVKCFRKSLENFLKYINYYYPENKISDFQCTFNFCILYKDTLYGFQIGDGATVYTDNNEILLFLKPQNGEFINSTFFITDFINRDFNTIYFNNLFQYNEVEIQKESYICSFTDGLLDISFKNRKIPFATFFKGIFNLFLNTDTLDNWFTSDKKLIEKVKDDRTLIIIKKNYVI